MKIDQQKWRNAGVPAEWIAILVEASRAASRVPAAGAPGRGIASVAVDEVTAELTITLTDEQIITTGPLRSRVVGFATDAEAQAHAAANPLDLVYSTEVS